MNNDNMKNENPHLRQTDVISSLRAMNTRSKRMVQVRTKDELFEGELTKIAWHIDQWIFMVDGEWFNQSEVNCL